jgi:uncharacterized protein (TIRG00374 family)
MLWRGYHQKEEAAGETKTGKTTNENGRERGNSTGSFYGHFTAGRGMKSAKMRSLWLGLRRWLPGLIISGVALWLVFRTISWKDVGQALTSISISTLLLAIVLYLVSMLIRALCWQTLLQRKVPFKRAFFVMNEGYMLNNIFPFRLGEIGRAVIMGNNSPVGILPVFSTIIVERSYDLAISSILLLSTLPLALAMDWARPFALGILGLVIAALISLLVMARYKARVVVWLGKLPLRWSFYRNWILPKIDAILEGFIILTRPQFFFGSLFLMLTSWSLAILEDFVLLRNLIPAAPLWWVGFVLSASALGAGLPSVAAAIGVFEGAVVGTLSLLGVSTSTGLAFALVVHAIQFTFSTGIGAIGLMMEGENLSNLYHRLIVRKS